MPLSSKILRGLKVEGWQVYQPKVYRPKVKAVTSSLKNDQPVGSKETKDTIKEQEAIIQAAREEAAKLHKRLLEEAHQEAELLKNKAFEDGYAEGYKKGEKEGLKLQEEGQKLLKRAQKERQQILDGAEKEVIQLAISLTEKLIDCQIEMNPDYILSILSRSIEPLSGDQNFNLRVNPLDEEVCRNNKKLLMGLLKNESTLEVIADPEIPRGSCRIETEAAEVEFMLKKELEILAGKLLELAEQ
jgi:flagellar assembly protein FliH